MKAYTKNAIGSFVKMATKPINGEMFTSWRTPDNKHFYFAPAIVDLNIVRFGLNPENNEVPYTVLGDLDMVK